ncbi:tyrosine-type recombinase/integrase, partial [Enterococcus cecorum]|uniref:tyrosine-type recombinase/integrase n=1 Tax=Enterococcus cecorum TaxID=44008 RepID=UPI001FAD7C02
FREQEEDVRDSRLSLRRPRQICKRDSAELAGIKRIRTHDLRHSHASLLLEIGANNLELQSRLGHADISTTLGTYSHLRPNGLKETANRIEDRVDVSDKHRKRPTKA